MNTVLALLLLLLSLLLLLYLRNLIEGVLSYTDVVGMHFEAEDSIESHPTASYCDRNSSVDAAAAKAFDKFCSVDASDQSLPSHLTAEEIIKCASETAALRRLSGSLLLTRGSDAVSHTEIPYRDNQIDGAEDTQENACEQSEAVCSTEIECDVPLKATECSVTTDSSCSVAVSLTQKTVAVAALPLGVYITKPSPATDSNASKMLVSEDADYNAGICEHDRRRLQLQKQFPILHLGQQP